MNRTLLLALTIIPVEAVARYWDDIDYGGDDGGSVLLILIPVCICVGYLLGNETRNFRQARNSAIAIAVMLAITALFVPSGTVATVAGATALAGLVGLARRK